MSNCGDSPRKNLPAQAVGDSILPPANSDAAASDGADSPSPFGETRPRQTESINDRILLFFGIFAICTCSWLFYLALESSTLHVSLAIFEIQGGTTTGALLDGARLIAVILFASLGAISAYKVSNTLTALVLLQLIALNLVLHVILSMVKIDFAVPLTLWLSSWLAFAFGRLVKQQNDLRNRLLARDHELEMAALETSELTLELIKHDEFERRILAADLHDQVLNDLKLLREKLTRVAADGSEFKLTEELELIGRSMQQVREVMDDLSPTILEHLGLPDAVESCIRSGSERAGYKVRFRNTVETEEFSVFNNTEQTLIYRLVQECVTNICKHAEAGVVRCTITGSDDEIVISIRDDGKGIGVVDSTRSRGLSFMHRRAEIIRAHVSVTTGENGLGTRVDIILRKPDAKIGTLL